jgi:hypothetical protein
LLTRSTKLRGGSAEARTTPFDTVKCVPFCARDRITEFSVSGTRTVEALTPTNWEAGTNTYRVGATTTGAPEYPLVEMTKVDGTGAHPM